MSRDPQMTKLVHHKLCHKCRQCSPSPLPYRSWNVTGTRHGSIVIARTEGRARRIFHEVYNGESILYCFLRFKCCVSSHTPSN